MKSGANTESIINTTNSDLTRLTKNDVYIIWGGPQDVAKNETDVGLHLLKKSVYRQKHTNLIVMSVPHRYVFEIQLCVNSEIKVFYRKLKKQD
jgi:hypothetical protein